MVTIKLLTSHFLTAKSGCIAELKKKIKMKSTFILLFTIFLMHNVHSTQMSLEEVNDTELVKLINQEQYVVVLFSKKKKFLSRILFYFLVMTFIIFFF